MKINKIFGLKSITNLIYGFLLMIPFVSILSRVIYVQSNDFAKDSYYGENINNSSYEQINISQLTINNEYEIITSAPFTLPSNSYRMTVYPFDNKININNIIRDNISSFVIYLENTTTYYFEYNLSQQPQNYLSLNNSSINVKFILDHISFNGNNTDAFNNIFYELVYNKYSYLDNVFDYSLSTFIDDYNLGNIDFFSWFTNMFLNQNNSHNALYLGFTNWYLNYALLVSSGYLLFLALIWFINWVRKLLEKSSYQDFGGF